MSKPFRRSTVQWFKVLGLLLFSALELSNPLNLERVFAQTNTYQGKTLRVIVGSSSGGGYDQWARLMAQHIGKHLPGHPTVIVQNMVGAGGVVAANYLYGIAKPDGLTIGGFNPALYFDQLLARPRSQIRLGEIHLDRLAGKKRPDPLHPQRCAVQNHRRPAQRQGTAEMRQHRHRQ